MTQVGCALSSRERLVPVGLRENFAANLKRLLRERNMTQRSFAGLIGSNEAVVSRWLKLKNYPDPDLLERVAAALGVEYTELVKNPGQAVKDVKVKVELSPPDLDALIKELARSRGFEIVKKK